MLLFGSTFVTFLGWGTFGIGAEFFSPAHTNSFSILATMLSNTTMVVGVGAMAGFKYLNYTVLPSVGKRVNLADATPIFRFITHDIFTLYLPLGLFALSLTLYDSYNLWSAVPALLAYGFVFTSMYTKAKTLQIPLWYSR